MPTRTFSAQLICCCSYIPPSTPLLKNNAEQIRPSYRLTKKAYLETQHDHLNDTDQRRRILSISTLHSAYSCSPPGHRVHKPVRRSASRAAATPTQLRKLWGPAQLIDETRASAYLYIRRLHIIPRDRGCSQQI